MKIVSVSGFALGLALIFMIVSGCARKSDVVPPEGADYQSVYPKE